MAVQKRWIFGLTAVAAVLVAGGIAVVLLVLAGSPKSAARSSESAIKLGTGQQARLEHGLVAPGIKAEAGVMAGEIRGQFLARGQPLLPAGSRIRIDPATFEATSPQTATVRTTVTGPQPGHWLLLLIKEGANWLLIGTRRLP
jgi:hypothetical protein